MERCDGWQTSALSSSRDLATVTSEREDFVASTSTLRAVKVSGSTMMLLRWRQDFLASRVIELEKESVDAAGLRGGVDGGTEE